MPTSSVSRSALRIVLFGMPDAGKSSLLGALSQAARLQEHLLNGHLSDLGGGLADLQRRLYEGTPRQTLEEILPFPVVYESFSQIPGTRVEAVVIDCDGRVANDLVKRRKQLGDKSHGQLGDAILGADAVLLAVDASAATTQVDSDLAAFVSFLRQLEQHRGLRTSVSGLPVFLVLTKVDLLAQAQDALTTWIERIEERKRQLGKRFEQTFSATAERSATPFGAIAVHPWATAVKRPALADSPSQAQEPFGVAELFRQCFEAARRYQTRQVRSNRRLAWTVATTGGVLIALSGLVFALFANRPGARATALGLQVERFEGHHAQLSAVARHKEVQAKIDELTRIRDDPAFGELSGERRNQVEIRLKELAAYRALEQQLNDMAEPRDAHSLAQLNELRDKLNALPLPAEYADEWAGTPAMTRRKERLEDIPIITAAEQRLRSAYVQVIQEGKQVLVEADKPDLPRRAKAVLDKTQGMPEPKTDMERLLPGSFRLTYRTVFGIAGMDSLGRQWEAVRKELEPFASRADKP